ncbi:16S rRNA (guanine(966)-N(2))-methyltransferase RsmD [Kushneria marisflavi]|uniref:Ribosomal RNA small subunit methyltransferase D n=1 Tax=Kushneria marisflavi TaxID=157779 RepID=A0A240UQH3_9GAMM|nr:16S rRNA (guanine(966)-N(2))-methyltransferase RsmD [Kushneria marisflavi]ART63734.1 16S rRNA (guanine(966)-N(2))-methyltransferase RsmD [Kushneria marisflavi]RKD85417.1 16S rRNA m(2)G-966 methyltransferase [Kushneria marisflavi]
MRRQRHGTSGQDSRQNKARSGSGRLRLIGGRFRRRLLPVLDHPGLRPTPDRVRETLFNWLATEIDSQTRVLDLFAGTGALGLEALSRGAGEVHFVEADRQVARQIAENLETLEVTMPVHTQKAQAFMDTRPIEPFHLVFLDPPFRQDLITECCQRLEHEGWLSERALIHVETEAGLIPQLPAGWHLIRETRAGDSHARLYRRESAQ